jgi:hypothetical protein
MKLEILLVYSTTSEKDDICELSKLNSLFNNEQIFRRLKSIYNLCLLYVLLFFLLYCLPIVAINWFLEIHLTRQLAIFSTLMCKPNSGGLFHLKVVFKDKPSCIK